MQRLIGMVLFFTMLSIIPICENRQNQQNSDKKTEIVTILSEEELEGVFLTKLAQENIEQEKTEMKMKVQIGDTMFTATLEENSSVDALKEFLADGSLTLNMSDYANMEKGADLGVTLPQNNRQMRTQAGDIILYQGRTFVIYYDTNSWSLTPIGKLDHVSAEELKEALGAGDVTVILTLEN